MAEAPQDRKCPQCGAPLPPDAPEGLCPQCLLRLSLGAPTEYLSGAQPGGTEVMPPAARPPPLASEIAPHFPQLEILECLGRGGMGVVYKARQPKLNRLAALKILAQEKAGDARFTERFLREAQALARLNHPNIVTIYDYGETGGLCYLLMEFVDGTNLREVLRSARMSPEQALEIVPRICEALQYAHEQGVVHRDIKPENILLDKQGRVKIADFGIAKIVGAEAAQEALTREQQSIGTPHYMAPEQVEKPATVDHRADIYSLGVVFYEMLTGELPLGKFAAPSKKVQVDVRLDEVVLHALEKEPERRYQKASQVKKDVETISSSQTGAQGSAAPSSAPPRLAAAAGTPGLAKPFERRFSRVAIAGVVLLPFASLSSLAIYIASSIPTQLSPLDTPHSRTSWMSLAIILALSVFGFAMQLAITICGFVSISQIRHSAGRLYGLGLAVFDALLFPLLLLDAIILVAGVPNHLAGMIPFYRLALIAVTIVGLDVLAVWLVWRAASRPVNGESVKSPETPTAPDARLAPAAVAAGCCLIFTILPAFLITIGGWLAGAFAAVTVIFLIGTVLTGITALLNIRNSHGRLYGAPLAWFSILGAPILGLVLLVVIPMFIATGHQVYTDPVPVETQQGPAPEVSEVVTPPIQPLETPVPQTAPLTTDVPPETHAKLEARLVAAAGMQQFPNRDSVMADIVGDAAAAGDVELVRKGLAGMTMFTTKDQAAGNAAKALLKLGKRADAFDAAQTIQMFTTRDEVTAEIAEAAAGAGDPKLAKDALAKITSFTTRDNASHAAALLLAKSGHRADAVEVARSIMTMTTRDDTLSELAK